MRTSLTLILLLLTFLLPPFAQVQQIRAFGQIVPDTHREYPVVVRTDGLIRNLSGVAVGDKVKKGDLLFTLYISEKAARCSGDGSGCF